MEEKRIHPETGKELVRGTRDLILHYKGKLKIVKDMPGWYPLDCSDNDGIHSQEDMKVSSKALYELKAEVDGKMINAKVIGIGAAGNKAAIALVENGVMPRSSVMLLNSTLKDVPAG